MMKFLLLALAITAVSAQADETDIDTLLEGHEMIDALLEADMELPCTPKPCVPVCKPVTKYLSYGSFKISYVENECAPDPKCLAAAATCVKKIKGLMVDADKKAKALEAASKKKNKLGATKAQKAKAAKKKKAEAAAAKKALSGAKKAFEVAEKEAATAKASKEKSKKSYTAKSKVMDKRLVSYEKAKKAHLSAVAAYAGAKSAAALAASVYLASVKAHCDAEAQHAAAVKNIGHGHHAKNAKGCAKYMAMGACTNTPGFTNGHGHGCASYENLWCANGKAKRGKEWTLGENFRFPEKHCCVCGKNQGGGGGGGQWYIDINNGRQRVNSGRRGGWSCDQVCQSHNKRCVQSRLNALNNNDAAFRAAYQAAGFSCPGGIRRDCERGNNCVRWGSPYIHNSHIGASGLCWGGSRPSVAPCGQRPVDGQHRRLCPCQ